MNTPNTLVSLAAAINGQRVLIVGDVMLDEYIWGEVSRISPEAPVPVVETQRRSYRAGGAGNVASNVVTLGGAAQLCAVVGNDLFADLLVDTLEAGGVACREGCVRVVDRQTTVKSRVIAHSQQMLRLDTETRMPITVATEAALLRYCAITLPDVDVCVLSDYAKGVLTPRICHAVIALARKSGVPLVVDPKGQGYARYAGATVITPNMHELHVAAGRLPGEQVDFEAAVAVVIAQVGAAALLITRGSEGMSLMRHDLPPIHIPTRARLVYDVTGAGDTVVAALALALAIGAPLDHAAALANEAAGIAVGKVGTATVTGDELRTALS